MSVFAIGDLHLPLGIDKPMNIFGGRWDNYVEKIENNWKKAINNDDLVLLCGDISWATYLEQSLNDFEFLNRLPGIKLIIKGNHDYWWTTQSKLNKFLINNSFFNFYFLQNNAFLYSDVAICGTRGWKSPFDKDFSADDQKIYERELIRLRLSLEEGKKKSDQLIVMMHYPPDYGFYKIFDEYKIKHCVFGHLHGEAAWKNAVTNERDILVSSDYLKFEPYKIL
jgi:predicted phosphohydrolase